MGKRLICRLAFVPLVLLAAFLLLPCQAKADDIDTIVVEDNPDSREQDIDAELEADAENPPIDVQVEIDTMKQGQVTLYFNGTETTETTVTPGEGEKQPDETETTETPSEDEKQPDGTETTVKPTETGTPEKQAENATPQSPKTGDSLPLVTIIVVIFSGFAGAVSAMARHRKVNAN